MFIPSNQQLCRFNILQKTKKNVDGPYFCKRNMKRISIIFFLSFQKFKLCCLSRNSCVCLHVVFVLFSPLFQFRFAPPYFLWRVSHNYWIYWCQQFPILIFCSPLSFVKSVTSFCVLVYDEGKEGFRFIIGLIFGIILIFVQQQRKRSLEFRSTSLLSCNLSFIVLAIIIPHFLQSSQKNGKIDFERKIDRRTDGWMDNSGTKVSLVTEQSIIRTCCFKRLLSECPCRVHRCRRRTTLLTLHKRLGPISWILYFANL